MVKSITNEAHKQHTMFQGAGNYIPRVGTKTVQVKQDLDEYLALKGKNAAYKDWLHKLNRNDKLPRGKFFKGKKAGKPIILVDEFWQFCSKAES
ncbi:hypothetical protein [Vibrio rotiferianus]|uniref:hypothetical protein n=1 Tax=Vibrio rotiferianus TaxID=190895 RepID=UPI0005EDCDE5|nr:hypothetical protein [Vibrio rotiferianus]